MLRRARRALPQRRLRRRKPRDRHAERGARHVVEADLVAERDRGRVAAVLAADAELELRTDGAAARRGDPDEFADAVVVDRYERVDRINPRARIGAEEGSRRRRG